jgi:ABC-type glycerol-3-phosphate transport system permease component
LNSLKIALGTSVISVIIGVIAAYAFARFKFRGREVLMLAILGVLMLPPVATLTPLFVMLNQIQLDLPLLGSFNLRASLLGVGLAVISGLLPFAIWNLKGYLDTIPGISRPADGAGSQTPVGSSALALPAWPSPVPGFVPAG